MKTITLKESIGYLKFLKEEALSIAEEQEKISLDNDVILFETVKDKETFIQGFINGACWQKGRSDASQQWIVKSGIYEGHKFFGYVHTFGDTVKVVDTGTIGRSYPIEFCEKAQ